MDSISSAKLYRKKISTVAARLLAEGFIQDYHQAKLKAVKSLGLSDSVDLPSNEEVEAELKLQQSMLDTSSHEKLIRSMRIQALEAMQEFEEYTPRLTGPVLDGTATQYSPIEIQVFSDSPKDMVIKLLDLQVPFETEDRKIRLSKINTQLVPVYCFGMGEYDLELTSLEPNSIRQSPLSPINGLPMERASIKKLKNML